MIVWFWIRTHAFSFAFFAGASPRVIVSTVKGLSSQNSYVENLIVQSLDVASRKNQLVQLECFAGGMGYA